MHIYIYIYRFNLRSDHWTHNHQIHIPRSNHLNRIRRTRTRLIPHWQLQLQNLQRLVASSPAYPWPCSPCSSPCRRPGCCPQSSGSSLSCRGWAGTRSQRSHSSCSWRRGQSSSGSSFDLRSRNRRGWRTSA